MTRLFISPHLDDVVFSSAGRLGELARDERVVVATLFTRGDGKSERTYRARREEDRDALRALGAAAVHLGLVDAPYRLGLRFRFEDLALGPPPSEADVNAARAALAPLFDEHTPDEVWFPLAVGGHVDHRVAFACHPLAGHAARFYVDRPYAFSSALWRLRRLELEGGHLVEPPTEEAIDGELGVLAGLLAPDERARCVGELADRLGRAHPGGLRLDFLEARYPADAIEHVLRYRSQLRWFGGAARVREAYARHAMAGGVWLETSARVSAEG